MCLVKHLDEKILVSCCLSVLWLEQGLRYTELVTHDSLEFIERIGIKFDFLKQFFQKRDKR